VNGVATSKKITPPPGPVVPISEITVNVNIRVALPEAFVAVIVYEVALCADVGVPESNPVEVLNVRPPGAAGDIEKLAIAPPVEVRE
jgi:hypothetical protein